MTVHDGEHDDHIGHPHMGDKCLLPGQFRVEVTYRPGNTDVHDRLTADQVQDAAYAYTNDVVGGSVIKLVIEKENP